MELLQVSSELMCDSAQIVDCGWFWVVQGLKDWILEARLTLGIWGPSRRWLNALGAHISLLLAPWMVTKSWNGRGSKGLKSVLTTWALLFQGLEYQSTMEWVPCVFKQVTLFLEISTLFSLFYVFEKNEYFAAVEQHVLCISVRFVWSAVWFKSSVSLLIFCLDYLSIHYWKRGTEVFNYYCWTIFCLHFC